MVHWNSRCNTGVMRTGIKLIDLEANRSAETLLEQQGLSPASFDSMSLNNERPAPMRLASALLCWEAQTRSGF
jgi:hypothetical protein